MRVPLDRHEKGLWVSGPKDAQPVGTPRRPTGLHAISPTSLRSRNGSSHLLTLANVHTLARYNDLRLQIASSSLILNGVPIVAFSGTDPQAAVVAQPTAGVPDRLFLCGEESGTRLADGVVINGPLRVEPNGTPQLWGVTPPNNGFAATKDTAKTKSIHTCDSISGWAVSFDPNAGPPQATLSTDGLVKTEGLASAALKVPKDSTGYVDIPLFHNLTLFDDGTTSPDEDWIALDVRFDRPRRVESMQLTFLIGFAPAFEHSFQKEVLVGDHIKRSRSVPIKGIGDVIGVRGDERTFIASPAPSVKLKLSALELMGKTSLSEVEDSWATLLLPKSSFVKEGDAAGFGWSYISHLRLMVRTNQRGAVTVYFDNIRLVGGVGMQGDYQYKLTWRNSVTGSRSNANSTPVKVTSVARGRVILSGLPQTTEPGVDTLEVWRTLGNGERFFLAGTTFVGALFYFDEVADYIGLHSGSQAVYLEPTELPTDNLRPSATFFDAVFAKGRMFWLDGAAGTKGRVYWSPAGRAEGVQGFVLATSGDDDPCQKLIEWNDRVYVLSEGYLFEIVGAGEDDVFTVDQVVGAPGTSARRTVVLAGAYGIAYLATDGPRLFNGATSKLIAFDAVGTLFRGESAAISGGLGSFEPTIGAFQNDEYVLSSAVTSLALNLRTLAWRELGLALQAMLAEKDTGLLIGATSTHVAIIEAEGVTTDVNQPIPFDIETASYGADVGRAAHAQYIFVDIDPNTATLTVELVYDFAQAGGQTVTLGTISGAGRRTETYPIAIVGGGFGVRLRGSISTSVEVYAIECEVYQSEATKQPLAKLVEAIGGAE